MLRPTGLSATLETRFRPGTRQTLDTGRRGRSTKEPMRGAASRCGGLLIVAALAFPSLATAQEAPSQELLDCRAIGSDKDRLKCYDKALDDQYGVDEELQEKRAQYRRERFGLPVDDSGFQITELEATIADVESDMRTGITTIALDNGQHWRLTSNGGLRATMKAGMAVVISESGTGGYRIRIPDKTGFKGVVRVK